jgi:hypothetical protein
MTIVSNNCVQKFKVQKRDYLVMATGVHSRYSLYFIHCDEPHI